MKQWFKIILTRYKLKKLLHNWFSIYILLDDPMTADDRKGYTFGSNNAGRLSSLKVMKNNVLILRDGTISKDIFLPNLLILINEVQVLIEETKKRIAIELEKNNKKIKKDNERLLMSPEEYKQRVLRNPFEER